MAGPEPKFFDKNFVDEAATKTASTGQATVDRIFDRDNELKWQSAGSNDTIQESIQVDFKSGGIALPRKVDFLAVLGHNLKSFKFQHDPGTGFIDTPGAAATAETQDFTLFPITEVAADGIKLLMDTTQTANQEKKVGEVLALKRLFEAPTDEAFDRLGIERRPVAKITRMLDDGVIVNQLRWAGNRVDRYAASLGFRRLAKSNLDSILAVVRKGVFTIQPEPDERPDEFFLVTALPGGWRQSYTSRFKQVGFNLDIRVEEA